MKVSFLGEFNLVEKIKKEIWNREYRKGSKRDVIVGIGDDTAVVTKDKTKYSLVTTDMLVEGIHFSKKTASFKQIGWKSLACSLSDIAAMGGIPLYGLVSIGLPKHTTVREVKDLYKGIESLARKYKVKIIGGDTISSPRFFIISITLLGEIGRKELITRSGAKPGDRMLVTGTFGDAASGLVLLKKYKKIKCLIHSARYLIRRCLLPEPRIKESRVLAQKRYATAMIDCSDGLDLSIRFICKHSNVGAKIYIDSIPLSSGLKKIRRFLEKTPLDFALFGGEDYELVFTTPENKVEEVIKQIPSVSIIGEIITKKEGVKFLDREGKVVRLKGKGYEHFSNSS